MVIPIPGEKAIIKMWESLVDKGIGGLLTPWQMRRTGEAAIDLKKKELIAIAEAEREADMIRAGKRDAAPMIEPFLLERPGADRETGLSANPANSSSPELVAVRAQRAEAVRREVNIAKAVLAAEDALASKPDIASDQKPVESDWLYRWRDFAGGVSNEDMQKLWGNVLAGEVIAPGRYSFRTLDFLRSLSKGEADVIERVAPFVVDNTMIWLPNTPSKIEWIPFVDLLLLQGIGLINGVEGMLSRSWDRPDGALTTAPILIQAGATVGLLLLDAPAHFQIACLNVTSLGTEILSLCGSTPNMEYLRALGETFKSLGVQKVDLCTGERVAAGFRVISREAL